MSDVDAWMAEPPRNGRGQYLMADESGKVTGRTRVTTFANEISNTTLLDRWKTRMSLRGIAIRPDLYSMLLAAGDNKDQLKRVAEQALEAAGGSEGANKGTGLHGICAAVAAGKLRMEQLPPDLYADVAAYFRELARQGISERVDLMERSVYNATYDLGGTLDRIYTWLPCPICSRTEYIGDLKSAKNLAWSEHDIAVQCACYANSDRMMLPGSSEQWDPMPDVCTHSAIILHVPSGTGTAFAERIDIQAGWWAARICAESRAWHQHKGLRTPLIPAPWQAAGATPDGATVYTAPVGTPAPEQPGPISQAFQSLPVTKATLITDPFANIPVDDDDDDECSPVEDPSKLDVPEVGGVIDALGQGYQETPEEAADDNPAVIELEGTPGAMDYDAMAEQLFAAVPKSKAKGIMQAIARSLDDKIKLTQWAINIAKDIVRHPDWPERSADLIEQHVPKKYRTAGTPAAQITDAPKLSQDDDHDPNPWPLPGEPEQPAASAQIAANLTERQNAHADAQLERIDRNLTDRVQAIAENEQPPAIYRAGPTVEIPVPGMTQPELDAISPPINPFAPAPEPEPPAAPAEPVRDETYYLNLVRSANSKRQLADLWQDASDHGCEWTPALNLAGVQRMQELAAQLGQ